MSQRVVPCYSRSTIYYVIHISLQSKLGRVTYSTQIMFKRFSEFLTLYRAVKEKKHAEVSTLLPKSPFKKHKLNDLTKRPDLLEKVCMQLYSFVSPSEFKALFF